MKAKFFLSLFLLLLLSGCGTAPSRQEGGVTIDDGSYKNYFHWLKELGSN